VVTWPYRAWAVAEFCFLSFSVSTGTRGMNTLFDESEMEKHHGHDCGIHIFDLVVVFFWAWPLRVLSWA
jgi:hypothetical protein